MSFLRAAADLFQQKVSGTLQPGELRRGKRALRVLERLRSGASAAGSLAALLEACRKRLPPPSVASLDKPVRYETIQSIAIVQI